jgi:two-component system sensor histidine kinase CpxA
VAAITTFLRKLNPRNSLFGRILVWFWMALTLMIVMAFFIARYLSQSWDINALDTDYERRMQTLQSSVQRQLSKDVNINRALRRVSAKGRWNVMAVDNITNEIILGFPSLLLKQPARFLSFKEAQRPLLIRTNNMEFAGPFLVKSSDSEYQLFIGRLLRRDQRPAFAFGIALMVFLISGTIACIAIAWTIAKPIKELSKLSNDFALGIMSEPKPNTTNAFKERKDELGQLHNDICNMASNLAKSLLQQKALMANISHELRTPLTRLQLALAMLNPSGEQQMQYAKRIEKDIGVMDALIGQALQLAKINDENHAQWLQFEHTLLQELLSPMLDDLSFEARASDILFSVINSIDSNVELALIRTSFVSAVENVTRNAIKYSHKQVRVTLDVAINNAGIKMLRIQIQDDGDGLSDEQRMHIFEPFYRAPSGKHHQGTGLGLAIAKASVELHNGEISAQPSDMGGLCISLLFPITL